MELELGSQSPKEMWCHSIRLSPLACVCPPPRHTTENNLDSTSNSICRGKGAAAADYAHSHSPLAPCNMHEKAHEREKEE